MHTLNQCSLQDHGLSLNIVKPVSNGEKWWITRAGVFCRSWVTQDADSVSQIPIKLQFRLSLASPSRRQNLTLKTKQQTILHDKPAQVGWATREQQFEAHIPFEVRLSSPVNCPPCEQSSFQHLPCYTGLSTWSTLTAGLPKRAFAPLLFQFQVKDLTGKHQLASRDMDASKNSGTPKTP